MPGQEVVVAKAIVVEGADLGSERGWNGRSRFLLLRCRRWCRWFDHDHGAIVRATRAERYRGAVREQGDGIADAVGLAEVLDAGRARARELDVELRIAFLAREPVHLQLAASIAALEPSDERQQRWVTSPRQDRRPLPEAGQRQPRWGTTSWCGRARPDRGWLSDLSADRARDSGGTRRQRSVSGAIRFSFCRIRRIRDGEELRRELSAPGPLLADVGPLISDKP